MRRRAPIRSLRRRCGGASDRLRPPECAYLERAVYDENDLAEDEASWRDHIGDNPLPPLRPDEALQLLWLHRRTCRLGWDHRSEEHTSELQSLMRISYAVFCLKKKKNITHH